MSLHVRPAAVAGMFYPESAAILAQDIAQMILAVPQRMAVCPKAIIVPHAGFVYSGPIAASVYAHLLASRGAIRRVVLLGPTHRVAVNGLALPSSTAFATPLGIVPLDQDAIATIADLPPVVVFEETHAREHSLEVQLPFLQTVIDSFSLVPLAVGDTSPEQVAEVLERLWGREETLIVISSDLSHYLPYSVARRIDAQTAQQILELDPSLDHRQACGATPINGLLLAARKHGLSAQLVDLRNSGDTAGDKDRVVGYGAFAFVGAKQYVH